MTKWPSALNKAQASQSCLPRAPPSLIKHRRKPFRKPPTRFPTRATAFQNGGRRFQSAVTAVSKSCTTGSKWRQRQTFPRAKASKAAERFNGAPHFRKKPMPRLRRITKRSRCRERGIHVPHKAAPKESVVRATGFAQQVEILRLTPPPPLQMKRGPVFAEAGEPTSSRIPRIPVELEALLH